MDYQQINHCINKTCDALMAAISVEKWAEVELLSKALDNLMGIRDRYFMTAPMQALSKLQSFEDVPMMGMED